jgi:hypothetical protein
LKIRSEEEFLSVVDRDLIWRKKELGSIIVSIDKSVSGRNNAICRAGWLLVYAHWEGFIKSCATSYLEYVACLRLKNKDLANNLLTLSMCKKFGLTILKTNKHKELEKITKFYLENMNDRSTIPYKNAINAESNLSSMVLEEITNIVGVDFAHFAENKHLIDSKLLGRRNKIAHGESVQINITELIDLRDRVLSLMELFKNSILNNVVLKYYANEHKSI